MTYHAGLRGFGTDRHAEISCDGTLPNGERCNVGRDVTNLSGVPAAWFLDRKAAPGWLLIRTEEPFTRLDYCPKCKGSVGK